MDLATLERLIVAQFTARAGDWGLSAASLTVRHVLNWGGFVNLSFRIEDGSRRFHLKITADPDAQDALASWYRVHADLTARYHAPPVIDWVSIGDTGHRGLLFPHLEGATPTGWTRWLRQAIAPVLQSLHADRDLRDRARPGQEAGSCAAGYLDDFHRRFIGDLAFVSADPPAFVTAATLAWMREEADRLANVVARSPAFARPAGALIHGDLWPNNVLVAPNDTWYLLDWDDLRLGDPILDLAKLLDSGMADGEPASTEEVATLVGTEPDGLDRLAIYARAILLDWVIDPLADYLDADRVPRQASRVRTQKRQAHLAAASAYRARYG